MGDLLQVFEGSLLIALLDEFRSRMAKLPMHLQVLQHVDFIERVQSLVSIDFLKDVKGSDDSRFLACNKSLRFLLKLEKEFKHAEHIGDIAV